MLCRRRRVAVPRAHGPRDGEEADDALTFVNRKRYLIKTGGENVFPSEVEAVLRATRRCRRCACSGYPIRIEARRSRPWSSPGRTRTSPGGNRRFCRDRLAGFTRPRYVEFVASERIPRSATGKLQRHELSNGG